MEGLRDDEIIKLDSWEDIEYKRIEVEVQVDDGSSILQQKSAFTYRWNGSLELLYGSWSYEEDFLPIEDHFVKTNCPNDFDSP